MIPAINNAQIAWATQSTPLSALVWWLIPLAALVGASFYVLWVTRFQDKYENQTERSVGKFKKFQDTFKKPE
ncbi:MAG: hypothetical protein RJB54_329 [Actinomycetota bacterium]|jgi:hypothetical protein